LQYIAVNSKSLREKPLFLGCAQKFVNGGSALKAFSAPINSAQTWTFSAPAVFSRTPGNRAAPSLRTFRKPGLPGCIPGDRFAAFFSNIHGARFRVAIIFLRAPHGRAKGRQKTKKHNAASAKRA
jgi:hypothetical protein